MLPGRGRVSGVSQEPVPGLRPTRIPRDEHDRFGDVAPQIVERSSRGLELPLQATNRRTDRRDAHHNFGEDSTPG